MQNFNEFGLQPEILQALTKLDFVTPTPIQAEAIPIALSGHDIIGTASTGTGKTAAFGIPLISHLINNPYDIGLVIAPTRELAVQIIDMLRALLSAKTDIKTAILIGGQDIKRQITQLKAKPRLIVGTPGRINDHLNKRRIDTSNIRFLVLDETDRMLDMGFGVQIDRILSYVPNKRQTLLFSATLPDNILKLTSKYMYEPHRISAGSISSPVESVKQESIHISEEDKYQALLTQLETREGTVIVFVKTKRGAESLSKKLRGAGHQSDAIHGDLKHNQRAKAIQSFKSRDHRILVATDVAARGLDISHIETVINYDMPHCPEDYIHRIGRTGRAGAEGVAINLITSQDKKKWRAICMLINPEEAESLRHAEKLNRRREKPNSRKKKPEGKRDFSENRGKRDFGDNRNKRVFEERSEKPFRNEKVSYGEKIARIDRSENHELAALETISQRPEKREYRAKKPYGENRGKRDFGQRSEKPSYGDKPDKANGFERRKRADSGETKPYNSETRERKPYGDKSERKPYGDKSERKPYGDKSAKRPYSDKAAKPAYGEKVARFEKRAKPERGNSNENHRAPSKPENRGKRTFGETQGRPKKPFKRAA